MTKSWHENLPVLQRFSQVGDTSQYAALPDDWFIGVADIVDSTAAIEAGRYKAVNLAGAGAISAVSNELGGRLHLFVFGGDGARFALSPADTPKAAAALSRVAMWAKRDLNLEMRVGIVSLAEIRAAGFDVRAAFWQSSDHVRYAMFTGGGLEWAESQLKSSAIGLVPAAIGAEPNLTGLSCQWGSIRPKHGKVMSLIVKPASGASQEKFAETVSQAITLLEETTGLNPVPSDGPDVRWPSTSIDLQSRISHGGRALWRRRLQVLVTSALIWLVFKLGIRIGKFDPDRYRRQITVNTDFRKFDDGLMMTVDCPPDVADRLRALLEQAAIAGTVRYGIHLQDEALMTCVVPSVLASDHMHFVDGAGGGYAAAAGQLRQ